MQPDQRAGQGPERRTIRFSLHDDDRTDGAAAKKKPAHPEPASAPASGWTSASARQPITPLRAAAQGLRANEGPAPVPPPLGAPHVGVPATTLANSTASALDQALGDPELVAIDETDTLASNGDTRGPVAPLLRTDVGEAIASEAQQVHGADERVEVGDSAPRISPRHQLEQWLAVMVKREASDLILRSGGRPACRIAGRIVQLDGSVPHAGPMREVLEGILGPKRFEEYLTSGAADSALQLDGLGRFRINAYRQMGEPAIVLRRINDEPPVLDDLCLPTAQLQELSLRKRGIMLVTGVAGSGKSTTLAAMIQYLNETAERHVITLEDPVEMLFKEKKCVISQREVGTDVTNFSDGLRHALRQSPDVILIGEMRDAETVRAALDATETGHFVMSTLHTVNSAQTIERIVSFFPSHQHAQVRARLGDTLTAVLSQRLLPNSSGQGMVPAIELMQATPYVRELIAEGRIPELATAVDQGVEDGMISFNGSLLRLIESGLVEIGPAMAASDKPDELMLALRGFQSRGRGGPQLRMGGR
jgi:twitching motility protein PilT